MSQNPSPAVAFGGNVPANLVCGFCKKPVQKEFYRTLNRFSCASCAARVKSVADRNVISAAPLAQAAAAGLLVSLACAAAWAVLVKVSHFEIGIVASAIGVAVGKTVHAASGKRRGPALQWLAAALSVLGIVAGKLMLIYWQLVDAAQDRGRVVTPDAILQIMINHASLLFRGIDLLWIGIAVYAAWQLCRAPVIKIAGPYPLSPHGNSALQFNTVEPAAPPAAPEKP